MCAATASSTASRASVARDAALSVGLGAFLVLGTYGAAHYHAGQGPDAAAIVLLVGAAAALSLRRRRPVLVLWAVLALTTVYFLANDPYGPIWVAFVIAYYTAVSRGHRMAGAAAAAAGFAVIPWLDPLLGRGPGPNLPWLSAIAAWLVVVFGLGEWVRLRRQRAAETAALLEDEARRQAAEERLRIARELHDVLAHNISLINVQAGVALHINGELPEQAANALIAIKEASREALGELRSALDLLRQSGDTAPRKPAPGLGCLDDLTTAARTAGLQVAVEVEGEPVPLPASLDLAAYRIIQEAITNVIRHAAATRVRIRLTWAADGLALAVEDDGRGLQAGEVDPARPGGDGRGIAGMRERVGLFGGELHTGRRPGGGFQVVARLPVPGPPGG
jgi:signal transduction histidine kinase